MSEKQEYILSLKDLFTGKVMEAEGAAHRLAETMRDVALAVGVAFGIEKVVEFGKEVLHTTAEFEGFTNVIKYASIDAADGQANLDYLADAVRRLHLPMRQAYEQFSELQGGLYGTGVEGDKLRNIFEGLGTASSVLHLNADQFSRAGYALKEVGELGELQTRQMRMLAMALPGSMNLAAEAMGMSTEQLHKAMEAREIKAGPFMEKFGAKLKEHFAHGLGNAGNSLIAKMNDTESEFMRLQLQMGEDLRPVYIAMMDATIRFYGALKEAWHWLVAHKDTIQELAVGVGTMIGAYLVYQGAIQAVALWQAILAARTALYGTVTTLVTAWEMARAEGMGVLTAAQWALNVAMDANPIGLVIIALGALGTAIAWAYKHVAWFRAGLQGTWEVIKTWWGDVTGVFQSLYHIIHGAFTMNPAEVAGGLIKLTDTYTDAGKRYAAAFKRGYEGGLADFAADHAPEKPKTTNAPTTKNGAKNKPGGEDGTGKTETAKATGTKAVTINIKIDNLVKDFQVKTTNITQGAAKAKELVAQALLSAVNDMQITAGQ